MGEKDRRDIVRGDSTLREHRRRRMPVLDAVGLGQDLPVRLMVVADVHHHRSSLALDDDVAVGHLAVSLVVGTVDEEARRLASSFAAPQPDVPLRQAKRPTRRAPVGRPTAMPLAAGSRTPPECSRCRRRFDRRSTSGARPARRDDTRDWKSALEWCQGMSPPCGAPLPGSAEHAEERAVGEAQPHRRGDPGGAVA